MSKSGSITTTIQGGSSPAEFEFIGDASKPLTISAGLDDIGISMGGIAGHPLAVDLGLTATGDPNKPIALDLSLQATGDPNKPIAVDLGLKVHVDQLDIKLEPLEVKLDPVKVDLGLDNINVCLSLAFTQFPRMQVHMPKKYDWGFSLFGVPVVGFRVCGESSFVTEDNPPRIFQRTESAPGFSRPAPDFAQEAPYRVVLTE